MVFGINIKDRIFIFCLCIVIAFFSIFSFPSKSESAPGTVVVEGGTFLYWLYITMVGGGAVYETYEASQKSYEQYKDADPEGWNNLKDAFWNMSRSTVEAYQNAQGTTVEQRISNAGSTAANAFANVIPQAWQSIQNWLDGISSSGDVSTYHLPTTSGVPVSISATVDGKTAGSTVNGELNRWSGSAWSYDKGTSIASFVINSVEADKNKIYFTYTLDTGYIGSGYVFGENWGFDLSPGATATDSSVSLPQGATFPDVGFPENANNVNVPFPIFPPGFWEQQGADGSMSYGYDPTASFEIPWEDLMWPDGSVKHPKDWSGPWVGGMPYPGIPIPQGWTGDIPWTGQWDWPFDYPNVDVNSPTAGTVGNGVFDLPILGDILKILKAILDAILAIPEKIGELLEKLFIPEEGFFDGEKNKFEIAFADKFGEHNLDILNSLKGGESPWEDVQFEIMGSRVVIPLSILNDWANKVRPWITGFFLLLLALYNYNQIYFLIRGSHPISIGNSSAGVFEGDSRLGYGGWTR